MPKTFAVVAALVVAVNQVLPDDLGWTSAYQLAVGYGTVAAILVGARRLPREERLPWWLFAAAFGANTTGVGVRLLNVEVLHLDGVPSPADPLFLLLYPCCAAGIAVLVRRRGKRGESGRGKRGERGRGNQDWTAGVDAATITTGLGLLAWAYVIAPAAYAGEASMLGQATLVAYPLGDLVLLAMIVRLLRGGGGRGVPLWWVTASMVTFLIGDTAWVVLRHLLEAGHGVGQAVLLNRTVESLFLVAMLLLPVGALHPDARWIAVPAGTRSTRLSRAHLLLMAAASLVVPALLAVQLAQGEVVNRIAIVICSATLSLLVVMRMAQALREVERQACQVRELARSDELTGLPNRRAWNDELPRALDRARRDGRPVSVALLDLDRFQLFNDAYGRPAGDRLLKSAAVAWHSCLRTSDTLARYGGEEFVVLLPDARAPEARQLLERVLAGTPLGQTFSAGVAVWDGRETSDELTERVDAALHQAKAGGRNQIIEAANRPAAAAARK
ncbi:MAG TPA: GGDEF domain-containing protein [Actinoplanes sp.]|nr:GGDEF domain-containing protein [Actinoplanes sp.]